MSPLPSPRTSQRTRPRATIASGLRRQCTYRQALRALAPSLAFLLLLDAAQAAVSLWRVVHDGPVGLNVLAWTVYAHLGPAGLGVFNTLGILVVAAGIPILSQYAPGTARLLLTGACGILALAVVFILLTTFGVG